MKRIKVISQMIKSAGYDNDTQTMEVEFSNGTIWQYKEVPKYLYDNFMTEKSKGKYFLEKIKPFYVGSKIG